MLWLLLEALLALLILVGIVWWTFPKQRREADSVDRPAERREDDRAP